MRANFSLYVNQPCKSEREHHFINHQGYHGLNTRSGAMLILVTNIKVDEDV